MKILNYGSLNVDYVYSVDHILEEGETISSSSMSIHCGGKGLNQSVALARAGITVYHAGLIGEEGQVLVNLCRNNGIDTTYIKKTEGRNGHTIIQVSKEGENCILLYGGSNQKQSRERIDDVISNFSEGDYLLIQNEINELPYLIDRAYGRGMKIILNPSPYDEKLEKCRLDCIYMFIMNEIEGEQITGCSDTEEILAVMKKKYPDAKVVLTLGNAGSVYQDSNQEVHQEIFPVKAVDTTAAGDTYTGFFIASILNGNNVKNSMRIASMAASVAVTREGAAPSIPKLDEVMEMLKDRT